MTDRLAGTLDEGTASPQPAVPSPSGPVADGLLSDPTPPPGADTGTAQLSLIEPAPARGAYNEAAA